MRAVAVIAIALVVGTVASSTYMAVGPPNNLKILGGMIVGVLGTLAGATIGIVWSARHTGDGGIGAELWWLGIIWGLTLWILLAGQNAMTLGLHFLAVGAGTLLLSSPTTRKKIPRPVRSYAPVFVGAAILILLTSVFPPVTEPWWVPEEARSSEPLPRFALFSDSRFDASEHYPTFAIAERQLVSEWVIIAAAAAVVCLFSGMYGRRRKGG